MMPAGKRPSSLSRSTEERSSRRKNMLTKEPRKNRTTRQGRRRKVKAKGKGKGVSQGWAQEHSRSQGRWSSQDRRRQAKWRPYPRDKTED
jgi:hypothetical protein